jgi:hypothetical protein
MYTQDDVVLMCYLVQMSDVLAARPPTGAIIPVVKQHIVEIASITYKPICHLNARL